MLRALILAALAAAPALAGGGRSVSLPEAVPSLTLPAAPALAAPALPSLAAPALPSAAVLPALPAAGLSAARPLSSAGSAAPAAARPLPARLEELGKGVAAAARGLDKPGADPRAAGAGLERLLTGEKGFAASGDAVVPAPPGEPSDPEAALRAAGAVEGLASAAEELMSARGLKASQVPGPVFADVVREAAAQLDARRPEPAQKAVRAAVVRVVTALMPADKTARESLPRLVSVLQVMGGELARHDKPAAVVADAELFAQQVEASVTQAPRGPPPAPELPPEPVTPADPDGHAAASTPGSVFGWQPIELSPDHGFPALDRLIRAALSERSSAYEKGFELPGAGSREQARVFFYGEKHTDGGLIAQNMRRLAEDARPGKPVVVLVEGYTGWELKGRQALEYLAKRGLDPEALAAKKVTDVVVRTWESQDRYQASKHPLLQHHMDLLELNRLAYSGRRGADYYRAVAKAGLAAWRSRRELWRAALTARNPDLDAAVRRAAEEADFSGATVHVIAGTDHLTQSPRLDAALGPEARPRLRGSLRAALEGRPYWASQPANSPRPLRLVIMGPPASGKGTYASRLARDYGVVHISAGELLREHAKSHPDVAAIMQRGDLVPAELVVSLVRARLAQADVRERGFLLDGFPRRLEESRALREMLIEEGLALDAAIRLDVPERELLRRVLARGRADDTEPTFRNRMKVYHAETEPAMRDITRGTTVVRPPLRTSADADEAYASVKRALDESRLPFWARLKARLYRAFPFLK